MKRLSLAFLFAAFSFTAQAQEPLKLPALSPNATIHQDFSTSGIDISYSRPSMRGRVIFGDVVAYNAVWRTGANAATKLKLGEEVVIGGQIIKPGEYALYTIPGKDEWEVIINKGTGNWGTDGYDKAADVARFKVKPAMMNDAVQTFTINIANITYSTCDIELMWEKTKVSIPVKANNEVRLDAAIDKAINKPALPYQQAATYYLETGNNLQKALTYADKAIEQNPKAYWLYYLKARIAAKLGKKDEAIIAAKKSMELAKGTDFEAEYNHNNQKVIDSFK
jgi:tetratricopeptide (TPR) repeat protein